MHSITIKKPITATEVHDLLLKRWSPRSFSDKMISKQLIDELLTAASWSASASNEQPWVYYYAFRGSEAFNQLWGCLSPGNQPWAQTASILMVCGIRSTYEKNGKQNLWAEHDLGMANAQLLLQAAHRDIYGHLMGGYDPEKIRSLLSLEDHIKPVCMAALGYLGDPDLLDEPYKSRELTPRSRKSIEDFATELQ